MSPVLSVIALILFAVACIMFFGMLFVMITITQFKHTRFGIFVAYYCTSLEKYNPEVDMYCNILLMRHELNPEKVTKDKYHLNFSSGNSIWIANKFYGYGDVTFNGDKYKGKPAYSTFVKIIKLERELDSCLD